jgi:hypothetical protein
MTRRATETIEIEERSSDSPLERALSGEIYRSVFGGLRGVYELRAQAAPQVGELKEALARRVAADRQGLRHQRGDLRLVEWCGGWTPAGRGIFEAVIVVDGGEGRWRQAGRVRVVVRPDEGVLRWRVLEQAS